MKKHDGDFTEERGARAKRRDIIAAFMALLIALILLALGSSLAVVWHTAFLQVLQGLAPLLLLFIGVIFLVVGYSERKARREYQDAIHDDGKENPRRRRSADE